MDGTRHELLSRPVLARDEHAGRRRRHALHLLDQRANGIRATHDLVARLDRLAELPVLFLELGVLEGVAQRDEHAVGVERLLEKVVGAELGRFDRRLHGAVPADHDDDGRGIHLADALERLEPIDARHLHVEEDEVRAPLLERAQRIHGIAHRLHLVPLVLEELAERSSDPLLVVHHQHAPAHGCTL